MTRVLWMEGVKGCQDSRSVEGTHSGAHSLVGSVTAQIRVQWVPAQVGAWLLDLPMDAECPA